MAKRTIALNLRDYDYSGLLEFAEIIRKGFIRTAGIYPSPVPSLAEQLAANDKMREDLKKWGNKGNPRGSDLALARLRDSKAVVCDNLKRGAKHVMSKTPDSPDSWMEVGFVLKKLPAKNNTTQAVQNLRQIRKATIPIYDIMLRWTRPNDVASTTPISYKIYRSKDEYFNHAVYLDTVLMKANYMDKNVPSTGKWYYFVVPRTTAGDGVTSNPCTAYAFVDGN